MKTIFLSFLILVVSLTTQAQPTKAIKDDFTRFLKAYQLKIAKEYINGSAGMLPDSTNPRSIITNEDLDLSGGIAPELVATFHLGFSPYKYIFNIVQYLDAQGKTLYLTYKHLSNYGEPSKPLFFKHIEVLNSKGQSIKKQKFPPATLNRLETIYKSAFKRCDNYKGQRMVPLRSDDFQTLVLSLGRGGSKNNTRTYCSVFVHYQSYNSVCTVLMGELYFNKSKSVFEFKRY